MAFEQRSLDDYIDVAQRIADFRERYPEGTLQPLDPYNPCKIVQVQCEWCRQCIGRRVVKDKNGWKDCPRCAGTGVRAAGEPVLDTFIVYVAGAWRTPDDPRPGIGIAWEPYPGQTPYTAGSELQNAETSAWGRAIIAVGASDAKRGIASREEVRNRQAEREDGLPVNKDGSLSRSRTTDEQKAAAGVPTDAEQRELNRQAKAPPNTQPVERLSTTPESDPWLHGPAGLAPQDDPEDRPNTASASQLREMHALFTQLGVKDRDERIKVTRETLGIDMLHSSKQLSYRQAGDLLLALRGEAKAQASG